MDVNPLLSYLGHIRWHDDFQWYFSHLDMAHLIDSWQQGQAFTHEDWLSIAALGGTISVLLLLISLFALSRRNTLFRAWLEHKRSQLTHRPPRESRTKIEPKVNGYPMLQQVYNLHRLGMYDHALSKYRMALQSSPFDLNTYLVGVKIVSEMENLPHKAFVQFLIEAMYNLREKHPEIWNELARYGRETAPTLVQWQRAGEAPGDSDARTVAAAQLP
jgi:hypothetical protein